MMTNKRTSEGRDSDEPPMKIARLRGGNDTNEDTKDEDNGRVKVEARGGPVYEPPEFDNNEIPPGAEYPPPHECIFKCIREMSTGLSLRNWEECWDWLRTLCDQHYGMNSMLFPAWFTHTTMNAAKNIVNAYSDFLQVHDGRNVLTHVCTRQLLLFILLQEDQGNRGVPVWINDAFFRFINSDQSERNFLIRIAQKGNGHSYVNLNTSGFYPRDACFFLCEPRDSEPHLTLHANTTGHNFNNDDSNEDPDSD